MSARSKQGQMTVELAVLIPVFIALSLVVYNALLFFEHCAAFDRHALEAVRVYAASPAARQTTDEGAALVKGCLDKAFPHAYTNVTVSSSTHAFGHVTYQATLSFSPTLFGRSFAPSAFGVVLFPIEHTVSLTIDPYRPGVVV